MAATIIGLAQRGGISWSFGGDGKVTYRFSLLLKVTTAPNLIATAVDVYAALVAGGYSQGAACPLDATALCTDVDPECTQRRDTRPSPYWEWTAKITYSNNLGESQPSNEKNPVNRPAVYDVSVHSWTDAAQIDIRDGGRIVNSADDPQVRPRLRSRVILSVDKNYSSLAMTLARDVNGTPSGLLRSRNRDPWTFTDPVLGSFTYGAGTGRMEDLRIAKRFDNATAYASAQMKIEWDSAFWLDRFVDMGFFYYGTNAYGREVTLQFGDGAGRLSPTPKLLDGAGHPLPSGSAPVIVNSGDGYQYYPTADWSVLALPGM